MRWREIKGVRISELSYNEFELLVPAAHQHRPHAVLHLVFAARRRSTFCAERAEEPTTENLIEALKPCFVLRYSDTYCRIKPAEMVRVKYRTPTGEKKNPCWDASQALCGLRSPANDPNMRDRLENPKWGLIIIEGRKKGGSCWRRCVVEREPALPRVVAARGLDGAGSGANWCEELEQFRMQDASGNRRNCYIFFDNDKAFKAGVTHALVETAAAPATRRCPRVCPNLPFGKEVKGADDFALAHCQRGDRSIISR